jgi:hypothetical protein
MILFIGSLAGFIMISGRTVWLASAGAAVADAALLYIGVGLFQREKILTQWK